MPKFSTTSAARLATCHPDLQAVFNRVIEAHDLTVLCGARGKAEQDEAVKTGHSKTPWPTSNHNVDGVKRRTSWAVDVAPYPVDWKDTARFTALSVVVLDTAAKMLAAGEIAHGLRWGGTFKGFPDMPHYELVGVREGE
jgi:peptidoglycan L-alanyl-D-glutamate endopeptidase CwlK